MISHFLFFVLSYLVDVLWIVVVNVLIVRVLSTLLVCFQLHDAGSTSFLYSKFCSDVSLVSFPKEKHESVDNFIFSFLPVNSSESVV